MTYDAASTLAARVGELIRADDRIVALARTLAADESSRATAVLEAIADRNRCAAAVVEAIDAEDRACQPRESAGSGGDGRDRRAHRVSRHQALWDLAHVIEHRWRDYNRIARRLAEARPGPRRAGRPSARTRFRSSG